MHKRKEILHRTGLIMLLAVALFVSGCTPKPTDAEIYISEFVLHDINDTTKKVLEAPAEKYGSYSFDYNMPGNAPERYSSIWFFFSPGQWIAGSSNYPVASGGKQILYAYESNPVSENYEINLSLSREISLNYVKANDYFEEGSYGDFRKEFLFGEWSNKYINLKPDEQKEYSFGGAYTPGSIVVEKGYTHLRGEILSGENTYVNINTNISICAKTETSEGRISCKQWTAKQIDAPHFEIYEDGIIVQEGNLTQNYYSELIWATWPIYYDTQENKNYIVNLTIPSHTQTFAKSIVTAVFSTEEKDKNPPWLTELKADAGFNEGSDLEIRFNAQDDQDLTSIKVFSRSDNGEWKETKENLNPTTIAGAKPIKIIANIPVRGNKIDLRIELKDNSGNSQTYTILPISFNKKDHELKIEVNKDKEVVSPGTPVKFSGKITDLAGNGISNLFISAYYNGKEVAKAYTQKGFWDFDEDANQFYANNDGNFSFLFKTPLDYTQNANFSIVTKETGTYNKKEYIINGFGQIFGKDLAILDISAPGYLMLGDNEINVTIVNVGEGEATAELKILQANVNGNDEIGERSLLKSIEVSLQPKETRTISLKIQPQLPEGNIQKIIASIVLENDANEDNNEQSVFRPIFVQTDAVVKMDNIDSKWIVNESKNVQIRVSNRGLTDLTDVNYTINVLNENEDMGSGKWEIVASGTIESLKSRNEVVKEIPLKFSSEGRRRLQAKIQVGGDLNPSNDIDGAYVKVLRNGPDMVVNLRNFDYDLQVLKGEPIEFEVNLINEGTMDAKDVKYTIYARESELSSKYEETGYGFEKNDYKLITAASISEAIKPSESKIVNLTYIPKKKGKVMFMINVSTAEEVNLDNNEYHIWKRVNNNGRDVAIDYVYGEELIVGKTGKIFVGLSNVGNESLKEVNVSLIINEQLIEKKFVELPFSAKEWENQKGVAFDYTPNSIGKLKIKVLAFAADEKDISDNRYSNEISVYEFIPINISIADSKENAVTRFLFSLKEIFVNDTLPIPIEFYNDNSENSVIGLAAASFRDDHEIEEQTDAFYQSISFAEPKNLKDSERIISERYDNITQNGVGYYSIFANKPTFNYTSFRIGCAMMKRYAEKIGINFSKIEGYTLFYCTQFDFNLQQCSGQWNRINKNLVNLKLEGDKNGDNRKILIFEVNSNIKGKIEAFALSKMPTSPSVRANLGSSNIMNNFTLEDNESAYGKIEFKSTIDVSRIRATSALLQDYVVFDNRKVFIDTNGLGELKGKSAKVTIKNIVMRNPQIYYNGALCPSSVCSNKAYNSTGKYITFDVSGFSSFEIVEGAYCGDGICQARNNENCNSCPSDCGVCSVQSSWQGGGQGGCLSKWNCTWGACVNNVRKETCIDLRNCGINRPTQRTEICIGSLNDCIDQDADGYGIGADCIGRDINDNDAAVTTMLLEEEKVNLNNTSTSSDTQQNEKKNKQRYYFIGLLALAILIIFSLIVIGYNRNKKAINQGDSGRKEDIAKNLKKEGWSKDDINWLTKK